MQTDILLKRLQTFEFLRGLDSETLATLAKSAVWKFVGQLIAARAAMGFCTTGRT